MKKTRQIDIVHETLGCVGLVRSTDDEFDHTLRQGAGSSEQLYPSVRL